MINWPAVPVAYWPACRYRGCRRQVSPLTEQGRAQLCAIHYERRKRRA
jgi:hypothetical protein